MTFKHLWLTSENHDLVPLDRWQSTVNLMADLFKAPAAFIVQHTPNGFRATIASQQIENPYGGGCIIPLETNIFCRKIVETRQQLYVNHATADPEWESNPEVTQDGFNSYLGFPIFWPDGDPFGTICVMDFQVTQYDDTYIKLIEQFRDLVQTDLLLAEQFESIRKMALNDELTGLFNRRGFLTVAEQRIQLARRNDNQLSLIYLDMDGLKAVNDQIGHEAGDHALQAIAQSIQDNIRSSDICARVGGDEFLILAETAEIEAMEKVCARIEAEFKTLLHDNMPENMGLSYGVVIVSDFDQSLEYWLKQADQKMYQLKQKRRQQL